MTLIVAICIRGDEANKILISSDSQATMGPVTFRVHKIGTIIDPISDQPLAIAAGAGDTALIKKQLIFLTIFFVRFRITSGIIRHLLLINSN